MSQRANYLHEVGMLNRTPRSGFAFLGSGAQSVAEHIYRMMHVAFVLARMSRAPLDEARLMRLVMFHDLPEARTGDHNYVNRKYVTEDLELLLADGAREWCRGDEIVAAIREFESGATPEARLAKDADQLELLLVLKQHADLGKPNVADWIAPLLARLKTDAGKRLAAEILATRWDAWWFGDKNDAHWIQGKKRAHAPRRAAGKTRKRKKISAN
ncbi:MAG: HD domain-containing protein [Chloroflexi bacterium]|nr:HD domain-containing protein [Chloroflexota bacterium]